MYKLEKDTRKKMIKELLEEVKHMSESFISTYHVIVKGFTDEQLTKEYNKCVTEGYRLRNTKE
jgi:outer membrane protein OmpA-like peptidoglycan-associated protein